MYLAYSFGVEENEQELLIAFLSELDFHGFEQDVHYLTAFAEPGRVSEDALQKALQNSHLFKKIPYSISEVEAKNWNADWEHSFSPVIIKNKLTIRATFHKKGNTDQEIIIDPKMAFGTGHHATTYQILEWMLEIDFTDKTVVDWGAGSGILSILASKLNCKEVFALEIDPVALESINENSITNNTPNIHAYQDEHQMQLHEPADIILMNINKNTILDKLNVIPKILRKNGLIVLSGFYTEDSKEVITNIQKIGIRLLEARSSENWSCLVCKRSK